MSLPDEMLVQTPYGEAVIRVGERKLFYGPEESSWTLLGPGIRTAQDTISVTRNGNDDWTVSKAILRHYSPVYLPWLPIPTLPSIEFFRAGDDAATVNAMYPFVIHLTTVTPPAPADPPPLIDPPPQPPLGSIQGTPYAASQFGPPAGGTGTMPYRVSFIFKQEVARTGGWSENFWNSEGDLDKVQKEAKELAKKLRFLHGRSAILRYIRVARASAAGAVVPVLRQTGLDEYQKTSNDGVGVDETTDYPTNALSLVLSDGGDNKTRQWIKGMPDSFTIQGGFLAKSAANYVAAFDAFKAELIAPGNHWCIRCLDAANTNKIVKDIASTGIITTIGAHGFLDGTKVRIRNSQTNKYPNKVWRITVGTDTDKFTLLNFHPASPWVPPTGDNIYARFQGYAYVKVTEAKGEYTTKKNVGRPTKLLTGKAKKKR